MKSIITVAALVLAGNVTLAQTKIKEADVPKAVLGSFQQNFKGAKVEKWEKEKNGEYEAEFTLNKQEQSANFSTDGKLLQTETEIKVSELPKAVSEYVTKNYAGYKISEAAKIVDPAGVISYEAEVEKGKEEFDLIFDSNGGFLKKEVESGEDKDDKKKD
jgi:hypothetical protein